MVRGLGLLDGGASKTVGGVDQIQIVVDEYAAKGIYPRLEPSKVGFTYAGGEEADAYTKVLVPVEAFGGDLDVHAVDSEKTPILIGVDMLTKYQLVLDYHKACVYSYLLDRYIPCVQLSSGHLSVPMGPLE